LLRSFAGGSGLGRGEGAVLITSASMEFSLTGAALKITNGATSDVRTGIVRGAISGALFKSVGRNSTGREMRGVVRTTSVSGAGMFTDAATAFESVLLGS